MTDQDKKRPEAKLTDDQLDQVAGGAGIEESEYCSCEQPQFYINGRPSDICGKCGKPLLFETYGR